MFEIIKTISSREADFINFNSRGPQFFEMFEIGPLVAEKRNPRIQIIEIMKIGPISIISSRGATK